MTTRICVTTIGAALFLGAASFSANAEEKSSAPILLAQSERGLERGKGHDIDKNKDKDKQNNGKDVSDAARGGAHGDTSDVARSRSGSATGAGGAGTGTGGS